MTALPTISTYGNYTGGNYGVHALRIDFDHFTLFYSYRTVVAYHDFEDGLVVCENVWGNTTGKHLNEINRDHKSRLPAAEFDAKLQLALARHIQ